MLYEIKRYNSPNFESRGNFKPVLIVNHITDGTEAVRRDDEHEETAVYNTFMNPACQASSTLTITRDGRIKQFVDIVNAPWTQGLGGAGAEKQSKSPIVREMGWRTNMYCLSIEYDAWGRNNGGDGNITEAQFWAGVWAHKWLQKQVQDKYGYKIQLNNTYVIGHCHVDPVRKPLCPGVNFPWARMYQELAIADDMTFEDYEERLQYLQSDKFKYIKAYSIANEALYLHDLTLLNDGRAIWAKHILLRMHPVMTELGLMKRRFDPEVSHDHVKNEILFLYNKKDDNDGNTIWAREQLLKLYPYMLQNGLVPA